MCINEVGLNSFIKLKKLRLEHLDYHSAYDETFQTFLSQLKVNKTLTFVKLERIFVRDNDKLIILRDTPGLAISFVEPARGVRRALL